MNDLATHMSFHSGIIEGCISKSGIIASEGKCPRQVRGSTRLPSVDVISPATGDHLCSRMLAALCGQVGPLVSDYAFTG